MSAGERPARIGEQCTCGRTATVVYQTAKFGGVPYCGVPHPATPATLSAVEEARIREMYERVTEQCGDEGGPAFLAIIERFAEDPDADALATDLRALLNGDLDAVEASLIRSGWTRDDRWRPAEKSTE